MDAKERKHVVVQLSSAIGGLTGMSMLSPDRGMRIITGEICNDVINVVALLIGEDEAFDILTEAVQRANDIYLDKFGIGMKVIPNPNAEGRTEAKKEPEGGGEMAAHRIMSSVIDRAKGGT